MASRSPIWWDRDKRIIKERSFDARLGSPPGVAGGLFFFFSAGFLGGVSGQADCEISKH